MNQNDSPLDRKNKFDTAFNSILNIDKMDYPNWIAGIKFASAKDYVAISPIDHSIQFGRFQQSEPDLPSAVMPKLQQAFQDWSSKALEERMDAVSEAAETLEQNRYRLAATVAISAGMTEREALFEVDRLLDVLDDLLEEAEAGPQGRPMGVWAVLSSYNSPLAGPLSYAMAAILAGNVALVVPPAECPMPLYMAYGVIAKGPLAEAISLATDPVGDMRRNLMDHPDLAGIAVCGSGELVDEAMFTHVDDDLGFVAEIKGMNPAVVLSCKDLEAAAAMVVESAFSYSGQRMDSCSKVIVLETSFEPFLKALLREAEAFTVGDPADSTMGTGPLASPHRTDEFLGLVKELAANVVYGGKAIIDGFLSDGEYVSPAILVGLDDDHEFNTIDHSLPFLSVQTARDMDEALELVQGCETGISAGVFSDVQEQVERFLAEVKTDVVYVNSSNNCIAPATKARLSEFLS